MIWSWVANVEWPLLSGIVERALLSGLCGVRLVKWRLWSGLFWVAFVKWALWSSICGVAFTTTAQSFLRRLLLIRRKNYLEICYCIKKFLLPSRCSSSRIRSKSSHTIPFNPLLCFHPHTINWRVQSHTFYVFLLPPIGATCPVFHHTSFRCP